MLKTLLVEYLETGIRKDLASEANRKILTVNLFGLVGLTVTTVTAFSALLEQRIWLACVLFLASFVYYLGNY